VIDFRTYARNFKWGWVDAVKEAEAIGNLTALARVLRSVSLIEPSTRDLLARLCDSRRLVRKRGRQLKPLFGPSEHGAWVDALREAEKSGDLRPLARCLRSDIVIEQSTRELIAKLFDRRRLARKQGAQPTPIFEMSADDEWRDAAKAVRQVRQLKRRWKKAEGAEIAVRFKDAEAVESQEAERLKRLKDIDPVAYAAERLGKAQSKNAEGVEIEASPEFNEQVRRDAQRLKDIEPVAYVAEQLDKDAKKLRRVAAQRTSFGRGEAKPKPKPKNSKSK